MSGTRSRGPEPESGLLVVAKPAGPTSHDVVDRVRRRFGWGKVGHGGTLDPAAEGVLVLGCGRSATRLLGGIIAGDKEYRAVMELGVSTDSGDAEGRVLARRDTAGIGEGEVRAVLSRFRGPLLQVPPMHSALKQGGVRLYKLARRGETVPREARPVVIRELELEGFSPPLATLRILCSKGTYIRTLCADIGEALGCGAHLARLTRTRAGEFTLEAAIPLEELLRLGPREVEARLILPAGRGA